MRDEQGRIERAYDPAGRHVRYSHDDRGRLVRAADRDGVVRTYAYNDRDDLVTVRDRECLFEKGGGRRQQEGLSIRCEPLHFVRNVLLSRTHSGDVHVRP